MLVGGVRGKGSRSLPIRRGDRRATGLASLADPALGKIWARHAEAGAGHDHDQGGNGEVARSALPGRRLAGRQDLRQSDGALDSRTEGDLDLCDTASELNAGECPEKKGTYGAACRQTHYGACSWRTLIRLGRAGPREWV